MSEITFPKGCTHVRIVGPTGKKAIVKRDEAHQLLKGVPGVLTFLAKTGPSKKKNEYTPFAGADIPNPLADNGAPAPAAEKPKDDAKAEVKAPVEAAQGPKKAKYVKKPKKDGKCQFIASLITGENKGKHTARQVAQMVVEKFPESGLGKAEVFDKALRLCRAVPQHLKVKGIAREYASEVEARKAEKNTEKLAKEINAAHAEKEKA